MEIIFAIMFIIIGIFVILMNINSKPYTLEDHENDIIKDCDEEKWLKYQETKEFKKNEL